MKYGRETISYLAAKIWPLVPEAIKSSHLLDTFNPLMHNAPKWSDTFKNLAANAARFLKCVLPFKDINALKG